MTETSGIPTVYALLIGVDHYLKNRLPDGSYYGSLRGCVRDVSHVEAFLKRRLNLPQDNILKLTSTNTGAAQPPEPEDQWPTYENMVAAFKRLTEMAQPGDHVHIHYSGHGGRASTIIPECKGEDGLDEAIVPMDIGNSDARYLRDVELAKLLTDMVDKEVIVAVVVDSCHSGGLTRGVADVAVRGTRVIDTRPRPTESDVASHAELSELWDSLTESGTRNVMVGSGWLPEPKGYVLLAACRPSELAYEFAFDGQERNGALTYWLLDSLQDIRPGLSYKVLHDRILAKVHSQFERQTPQLQGEGDRVVFGADRIQPHYAVTVMQVDAAKERLLLNAGQAHGLRKGAGFAIYPHGTMDYENQEKRQALAEIAELGTTDSWARITQRFGEDAIEQGAQALLLGAGSVRLVKQVSLVHRDDLDASIGQDAALQAVEQAVAGNGWVEVAADGDQIAYQVAVNKYGEYEIWDRTGEVIRNLRPALKVNDSNAPAGVARRLVHLTKYHAIQQLRNHDRESPLAGKLVVELVGKQAEYDPVDPFEPEPFDDPGNTPILEIGEWTGLHIKNESSRSLNITVFDLQPDWGATQVYPSGPGDSFVEFEPGQEELIPLQAGLPADYTEGADILKVFATVGAANFRWLELPMLDEPFPKASTKSLGDPLDELLAAIGAEQPPTKNLNPPAFPSREWTTEQVEVRIQRPPTDATQA